MNGIRALASCIDAVASVDGEQPVDVTNLAYETVTAVVAHRDGYRLCFASGAVIHIMRGATFDVAGNPVIEPAAPAASFPNPRPLPSPEPGQPAAAPVAVHARGGGAFGENS